MAKVACNIHTLDGVPTILVVRWANYQTWEQCVPIPSAMFPDAVRAYWRDGVSPMPLLDQIDTPEAEAARLLCFGNPAVPGAVSSVA